MAGKCVMKLPHEVCGSSDALQVFENFDGAHTGFCFSCFSYIPDPLGDMSEEEIEKQKKETCKTDEEIQNELDEIAELGVVDLPERKLRAEALDYYGIKIGLSPFDGETPYFAHLPYRKNGELVRYKTRLLTEKKMWHTGWSGDTDLFGWEEAAASGAKRLIITEGEFDAVAMKRVLDMYTKEQYKGNIPAVVSLRHGSATAVRDLSENIHKIRKLFKEIAICFDQDQAGETAAEEVCKKFPDISVIDLPCKDANEGLKTGMGKAIHKAATFHVGKKKNTRLVWGNSVHDEARKPAVRGYSWPWKHVDLATKGIRLGETIYIGAGQKQGKSELVNQLGSHFIQEHGWPVLMAKPEEANNKTYKMVAGKIAGKRFHDPDVEFDEEAYDRAGEILKDKLAMINLYQHVDWETLKQDIYAAHSAGCKVNFIDPITNLVNGLPVSEQNTELQRIAQDISALSLDLGMVSFIFCHLRNPEHGVPHERGGNVESNQFAGSRAMARSCNLMFGLEGNRDPELPEEERNMRTLVLLEDREFGNTGRYPLYWDSKTTLFNAVM